MKTIAGCIAERDSNARNAALNCIGTAWMKDGDRVLTMIGNINPKEKAILDERIKRIAHDPQSMIDDKIRLTSKEVTQTRTIQSNVQSNVSDSKLKMLANSKVANSRPISAVPLSGSRLPFLVRKS